MDSEGNFTLGDPSEEVVELLPKSPKAGQFFDLYADSPIPPLQLDKAADAGWEAMFMIPVINNGELGYLVYFRYIRGH